ncbi:MAG: hypothetical protein DCC72_01530 [Burkholderiales bacterium]|nr:MAG: hypothetical protein DCC72_01530 [Burkholderiales bacterium]
MQRNSQRVAFVVATATIARRTVPVLAMRPIAPRCCVAAAHALRSMRASPRVSASARPRLLL